MPKMDVIRGLFLTSGLFCIPAICKLFLSSSTFLKETQASSSLTIQNKRLLKGGWWIVNGASCLLQLSVFVVMAVGGMDFITPSATAANSTLPICPGDVNGTETGLLCREPSPPFVGAAIWECVLGIILTSLIWWENFVDRNVYIRGHLVIPLKRIKQQLQYLRQKTSVLSSIWKISLIIAAPFILFDNFQFDLYFRSRQSYRLSYYLPYYAPLAINMASGILAHLFASTACRLCMQQFSFSLPITLTTPISLALLVMQCDVSRNL